MRISDVAFTNTLVGQIGNQESAITALEGQLGSGRAITQPSDNPTGTVSALALQSQISQVGSWQSNLATASSWLGLANSTANSVVDSLQQARTLVLQAANQGAQSPATYSAIAQQISGIASNLVSLANTNYAGRPIFAGTSTAAAAYSGAGSSVAYQGNTSAPSLVVGAGQTLEQSVTGPTLFGAGSASAFQTLAKVGRDLSSGSPSSAALQSDLTALDANISQATSGAAVLGNLAEQASSLTTALASQSTSLQGELGTLVSVNVPQVATQLKSEMTTYQAALWAASQAVPPSLVQYL